jgi:protein SCO1/2
MRYLILILLLVASGCGLRKPKAKLDSFKTVADFAFTAQDGSSFSGEALAGKVWVASFIFTSCPTTCPIITQRVAQLQEALAGESEVRFVSITIDPETDTVERLAEYAENIKADTATWSFLTGDAAAIDAFARNNFMLGINRPPGEAEDLVDFVHSNKIAIVDRHRVVRFYADGARPESLPDLEDAVRQLLE